MAEFKSFEEIVRDIWSKDAADHLFKRFEDEQDNK